MVRLSCLFALPALLWAALAALPARAEPLAYEPVGLDWSADEVERATRGNLVALTQRAIDADRIGCRRHCARVEEVFARLLPLAKSQSAHAAVLPWSLTVVRLDDVEALAMPGGQVVIGEPFIDRRLGMDEALAFVLAHEMAHSILEHERQALSFARLLLPRQVNRSVRDMYAEMDFNLSLVKAMEPVLQQGEVEADELGLMLASAAGYDPARQLAAIEAEAAEERVDAQRLVATHPSARERLLRLRKLLPLAQRQLTAERR